ncbi:MAG: HAD hydrolase family protein [candidate division WS1 bacterium]|jgi:YrbI family 3-deoxy-D-manno-octulosonate 8-phosphate phosphatase|nr:HAD hydrolase family protein [candidate division WS1 bacterium]
MNNFPSASIKLLMLDVDGTLSDGGMYFSADGLVMKRFDVRDGKGVLLLQESGVEVVFVTADDSPITTARARRLQVAQCEMNCMDKGETVRQILADRGLSRAEACYMGDDVNDLAAFAEVDYTVAPPEAVPEVRAAAGYITRASAGHGAVREVCDLLRQAQGGC